MRTKCLSGLVTLLLLLAVSDAAGLSVFVDNFVVLEYEDQFSGEKLISLRSGMKEFQFEFILSKSERVPYVSLDSLLSMDSMFVNFLLFPNKPEIEHVYVRDKSSFIRYSCSFYDVFKYDSSHVWILHNMEWLMEADFTLRVSKANACHDELLPDNNEKSLLLTRRRDAFGKEVFVFKRCLQNSWGYYLVTYVKGFGRIGYEYPMEGISFSLSRINLHGIEEYFETHNSH